jgi:hypothetical protein
MSNGNMKLAIAQIEITPARPDLNFQKIKDYVEKAKYQKADIVIFPELSIPGYLISDMWEEQAFLKDCLYNNFKGEVDMKWLPIVFLFCSFLYAQDTSMILVKKSALPTAVLQQVQATQQIESLGRYVGLGKEIGGAIREGLESLTDVADHFSKTKVGKFTMFLIAFKVLGYPCIQLAIGLPLLLFGVIMYGIIIFKYCLPYRYLKSKENGKKTYDIRETDSYSSAAKLAVTTLMFLVYLGIMCAIIFAH